MLGQIVPLLGWRVIAVTPLRDRMLFKCPVSMKNKLVRPNIVVGTIAADVEIPLSDE
jgi:hypothetical protein